MTRRSDAGAGRFVLSRRSLLRYGGVVGVAGLVLGGPGVPGWSGAAGSGALSTFTTRIVRREDQLALTVECVNLRLARVGEPGPGDVSSARLVRVDPATDAFLVVHFGPQSIAEHAYWELEDDPDGGETPLLTTPTAASLGWDTRLAFRVPGAVASIPYTVAGLLDWIRLLPSVVPTALRTVAGTPAPVAPNPTQTWIEAPWRVVLSPHDGSGWAHAVDLADTTHGGRTELWHTRLGVSTPSGVDESNDAQRAVRAVWTPGFVKSSPPPKGALDPAPLGRTSLSPRQRYEVVRLSSDYSIVDHTVPYVPRPLEVDRLMLSSLGAWLYTRGSWPAPVAPPDIAKQPDFQVLETRSWLHRATFGRDHYVRVVSVGCLLPVRTAAALVEVTERKFQPVTAVPQGDPRAGRPAAFLRKRMFLVPSPGWRLFDATQEFLPYQGREMPFKRVRITTVVTPSLAAANGPNVVPETRIPKDPANLAAGYWELDAFWPMVPVSGGGVADFRFALEGADAEGRTCPFTMPLVFVSTNVSADPAKVAKLVEYYNTDAYAAPARRTAELGGQRVALARFTGGARGEAAYPLSTITFGAALPDPPNASMELTEPRFFPRLARAEARLDAVERVRGGPLATPTHAVTLHQAWLSTPDNAARLFARLVNPVPLDFGAGADAAGGVIAPSMVISGLSALTGPIGGDLSGAQAPAQFTPADFFAGAAPEILGGISLLDVLADTVDFGTGGAAPRLVSAEIPGGVETSLTWRPQLTDSPVFAPRPGAALVIAAGTVIRHDGSPPTTEISGEITNFHLLAVGSIHLATVKFARLRFGSRNGRKPDVDADITGVEFHGILAFVNKLQEFLKSIGAGQNGGTMLTAAEQAPPAGGGYVEVTPGGIKIGATAGLPDVPVGVFLLENIGLTSELNIPFDGRPARLRFAFASRENPFHLTVAMFGGGGFCGVSFGLDAFELFEAALEFGAKLSLDIAVASGSVSVMAGVYLAIGASDGELTGFVRINGELDIIELVSMNVEFYLGLTYDMGDNEVWGEASVTVEIEVLVFSGSVTLGPIRKRFAGGGGGSGSGVMASTATGDAPSFKDLMSEVDWQGYCGLFAPAAFG